jgi:hypothetical protein
MDSNTKTLLQHGKKFYPRPNGFLFNPQFSRLYEAMPGCDESRDPNQGFFHKQIWNLARSNQKIMAVTNPIIVDTKID